MTPSIWHVVALYAAAAYATFRWLLPLGVAPSRAHHVGNHLVTIVMATLWPLAFLLDLLASLHRLMRGDRR